MEVNSLSKGYRHFNEDEVLVIKDHLFMVVDAATGLGEQYNKPSDGVFLAKEIKQQVLNLYHSGKFNAKTFNKEMNLISKRIYRKFIKGHRNELTERYQFPNASIAICFIDICDVHIFSIGDTSSFIRFKNNKVRYISDRSIPILDRKTALQGINITNGVETLRENRNRVNRRGRKASFGIYKNPKLKFKHELFDIRDLSEVYLCSDGYYEAFDVFKIYKNRRELFNLKVDLQDVYKNIVKYANSDPELKKYPRIKPVDDISAIRVVF